MKRGALRQLIRLGLVLKEINKFCNVLEVFGERIVSGDNRVKSELRVFG